MLESGQRVLREEGAALLKLADKLDTTFQQAVEWIVHSTGRVIACGIGKSGHIARKTAGTLASTGTPSLFLHAAEAVHGDLGMITSADTVLLYSHTGETDELVRLFPSIKAIGAKTILICGRPLSTAGRLADIVLDTGVTAEACPNNLAPTTSTTAMLALSDALAVAVMEQRGFGTEDFAKFHPGGALGKRLLLRVADVMRKDSDLALVTPETPVLDVLRAITKAGAGGACVVASDSTLLGFITDGDLRRHFLSSSTPFEAMASHIMATGVSTITPDLLAIEALEVFQNFPVKIGDMPVVSETGEVVGLIMIKDLLRSGIVS
ncbi:MAG: KpsF/GutQ family sugar-phosphate isomerase [Fimbriimonadaceae bacterium]